MNRFVSILVAAILLTTACTSRPGSLEPSPAAITIPADQTPDLAPSDAPVSPSSTPSLPPPSESQDETAWAIYHPNPQHLWNRLFRLFFERTTGDGTEYGWDTLDPLLWPESTHMFEGDSYGQAIELLDEFLAADGARLIDDPLKAAMLQRDLWAVFDWLGLGSGVPEQRFALQARIMQIIRALALTKEAIGSLPANYAAAVLSGVYPASFLAEDPGAAFLPAGFFAPDGDWICVGREGGPVAMSHTEQFPFVGRSVFLVFMRVPGSREGTLSFVQALNGAQTPGLPAGLEVALVRQALLVDMQGDLVVSPIVESIQLRQFGSSQRFYQFGLDRKLLFADVVGGLRLLEKEIPLFFSHGDGFPAGHPGEVEVPEICKACHLDAGQGIGGITSILSFSRARFPLPDGQNPVLTVTTPAQETGKVMDWKVRQPSWENFLALWGD